MRNIFVVLRLEMPGVTEELTGGGGGGGGGSGVGKNRRSTLQKAGETVIVQNRDDAAVGDSVAEAANGTRAYSLIPTSTLAVRLSERLSLARSSRWRRTA